MILLFVLLVHLHHEGMKLLPHLPLRCRHHLLERISSAGCHSSPSLWLWNCQWCWWWWKFNTLCLFCKLWSSSFEEAVKDERWVKAMDKEINIIEKNKTWQLIFLPKWLKTIGVKWVYKTKSKADRDLDKHNARLVVNGYRQEASINHHEVFALVARLEFVRLLIMLATQNK